VAAAPEITRLVLRKLAADAVTSASTLSSTLNAAAFGTVTQALSGKIVVEAQAAGVVTKYELPVGKSALIPQEVSAMLSRLLDLYDQAVGPATTSYVNGFGAALPSGVGGNDAAILQWMLGRLQVIRSLVKDHSDSQLR
jgi:hypothetical protein